MYWVPLELTKTTLNQLFSFPLLFSFTQVCPNDERWKPCWVACNDSLSNYVLIVKHITQLDSHLSFFIGKECGKILISKFHIFLKFWVLSYETNILNFDYVASTDEIWCSHMKTIVLYSKSKWRSNNRLSFFLCYTHKHSWARQYYLMKASGGITPRDFNSPYAWSPRS